MSDDELDREWKPSNRPQSTMARSFSLALNDLFMIDNSVADLDAVVSEKKKAVSSQASELEALEARLKATEERLKARQALGAGAGAGSSPKTKPSGRSSPRVRTPLGDTFASSSPKGEHETSPLATEFGSEATDGQHTEQPGEGRPASHRKQESYTGPPVPGALPPTPGTSEGEYGSEPEYVLVESEKCDTNVGIQDGDVPPPRNNNT
ncbi:Uncharacterized protein BP5553_00106 [Venustampulla echinocandica]|uniref:Uncharacterized protein n=1 Tax=Venustampulla echinocandica TaxID=2656787 RepID=A0A370TX79_9HELO|nr:Uncharacterized protein BP5553_00106 [Venustampulla echinocandica]RDL40127.1 Uncharacterized protein BP5553_00106 [Venustampulla echinocandica]